MSTIKQCCIHVLVISATFVVCGSDNTFQYVMKIVNYRPCLPLQKMCNELFKALTDTIKLAAYCLIIRYDMQLLMEYAVYAYQPYLPKPIQSSPVLNNIMLFHIYTPFQIAKLRTTYFNTVMPG